MAGPIFGIDIAKVVSDAIVSAGGLTPGVLFSEVIVPDEEPDAGYDDITAGRNGRDSGTTTVTNRYIFEGISEQRSRPVDASDPLIRKKTPVISILGASIKLGNPAGREDDAPSTVVPKDGDTVVFAGGEAIYKLAELIKVDPACAMYEFEAVRVG